MIIDSDVLIRYLRGNVAARTVVEKSVPFSVSVVTYTELLRGMRDKDEARRFRKRMNAWNVEIVQIDREISARAMFYVQEYALSHSMTLADALIAATVVQSGETLLTANEKHYKYIPTIECRKFVP
ncbi:MAG: type II toxin-antitoxin system VapC family toxin [Spirochaetales bacterium]|nr:type II toxin-antitoxin system VapC family toxin [Spirochaetales bacterium]